MFFKKIFYQFYVWGCKYNFANTPHLSAMYMLAMLLTLAFYGIYNMVFFLFTHKISNSTLSIAFPLLALITLIIYVCYTKGKKYELIFKEFKNKSEKEKKNIRYISIAFILISIFLSFGTAIFIGYLKKT